MVTTSTQCQGKNAWRYTSPSTKLSYIVTEFKNGQFFLLQISYLCASDRFYENLITEKEFS